MKRWKKGDKVRLQKDDVGFIEEGINMVAGTTGVVCEDTNVDATYVDVLWDGIGKPLMGVAGDMFNITSWEEGIEKRKKRSRLTNSDFEYLTGLREGDEVVIIELDEPTRTDIAVGEKGVVIDINPYNETIWWAHGEHLITVKTEKGHKVAMFSYRFNKVEPEDTPEDDGFYTKYPDVYEEPIQVFTDEYSKPAVDQEKINKWHRDFWCADLLTPKAPNVWYIDKDSRGYVVFDAYETFHAIYGDPDAALEVFNALQDAEEYKI